MDNSPRSTKLHSNTQRESGSLYERIVTPFHIDSRGQTSIDLVLGVMIFFSAVALITVQSPGLFFPGDLGASDNIGAADRVTIELTSDLSESGEHALSHEKVVAFLEDDSPNVEDMISLSEDRDAEVVVSTPSDTDHGPPAALNDEKTEYTVNDGGDRYSVTKGDTQENSGTTVTVHRTLDDRPVSIEVSITH